MLTFKFLRSSIFIAGPLTLMLSGCIDNYYDLSDIDTTAEFQVKDLVLPINIDAINLDNIIDVSENSQIKIVDGEYVFIEDGTFESSEVMIPQVYFDAPQVPSVNTTIKIADNEQVSPASIMPQAFERHYPIGKQISHFTYEASGVSDFIVDMKEVGTNFNVRISFSIDGLDETINSYTLRDFKLQIAPGLTMSVEDGVYDPGTGILALNDRKHTGSNLTFDMEISAIDVNGAGIDYNHDSHSMVFEGNVGIYSGEVVITDADIKENVSLLNLPESIELHTDFMFSRMLITRFTGIIKYQLDGFDIAPVYLTGIPDILSQNETNITLCNPQIYMSLNNPVAKYNLKAQSGITITANRAEGKSTQHSLDNGYFTIAGSAENNINTFCMSPLKPEQNHAGYESAVYVPYSSLSTVLSGAGLPQSLLITLDNPIVPEQNVTDFELGESLGQIQGAYTFYSPLELGAGSQIIYSSVEDGWNDEEIDEITIKKLEINTLITNNLPLDIKISGYPIDVNGNKINNVDIEGVDVSAGSKDAPLTIRITGEITHLDGIAFEAIATQTEDNKSLKPDATIQLKDIRVKVSGNYIKEL